MTISRNVILTCDQWSTRYDANGHECVHGSSISTSEAWRAGLATAELEKAKPGRVYRRPIRRRPPGGKKPTKSSSGSGEVVDPWGGG